ncbi:hypothetical protein FQR65_LT03237 [Abscondita terminalis]|nr:hypothetical protein FQR65_LT03237 [Abscondita terminalis]
MSRRDANTTKVFVGSLPPTVTTDDLKTLFAPYGNIVECDIANRCGFLHLEDKDLALKAIEELNNTSFMGGKISVEKGRVKPPRRNRDAARGGRDRGGPYARTDAYNRGPLLRNSPMADVYGREYPGYGDRYDYERGVPMRTYPPQYEGMDRRPMYDDRRGGYMDDRRGYGPLNGYDRRPYDDRGVYDERGAYDDRRLPPPPLPPHSGYDDRRPMMGNGRPILPQGGVNRGPPMAGYDRGPSADMYSRRSDYGPKPSIPPPVDPYGTSVAYDSSGVPVTGYAPVSDGVYGTANVGYSSGDGTYGANPGYATAGYDTRNQSATYGTMSGGYATAGYATATGGYATDYGNGNGGYSASAGYTDYNTPRTGATYDSAYSVPTQPRSFASGTGGPGPRGGGDMPPSAGHRFLKNCAP